MKLSPMSGKIVYCGNVFNSRKPQRGDNQYIIASIGSSKSLFLSTVKNTARYLTISSMKAIPKKLKNKKTGVVTSLSAFITWPDVCAHSDGKMKQATFTSRIAAAKAEIIPTTKTQSTR